MFHCEKCKCHNFLRICVAEEKNSYCWNDKYFMTNLPYFKGINDMTGVHMRLCLDCGHLNGIDLDQIKQQIFDEFYNLATIESNDYDSNSSNSNDPFLT